MSVGWLDRGGRLWHCTCPVKGPNCMPAEPCVACEQPGCRTEHNLGLEPDPPMAPPRFTPPDGAGNGSNRDPEV